MGGLDTKIDSFNFYKSELEYAYYARTHERAHARTHARAHWRMLALADARTGGCAHAHAQTQARVQAHATIHEK